MFCSWKTDASCQGRSTVQSRCGTFPPVAVWSLWTTPRGYIALRPCATTFLLKESFLPVKMARCGFGIPQLIPACPCTLSPGTCVGHLILCRYQTVGLYVLIMVTLSRYGPLIHRDSNTCRQLSPQMSTMLFQCGVQITQALQNKFKVLTCRIGLSPQARLNYIQT